MYDEMIKRLRCQRFGDCQHCPMWYTEEVEPNLCRERCAAIDAADAIEQLTADLEPRWIPVTERLPEEAGKYLVCGRWRGKPTETWVCDLVAFGNIKGWANEARNPAVTYWMPLPEPPKEET